MNTKYLFSTLVGSGLLIASSVFGVTESFSGSAKTDYGRIDTTQTQLDAKIDAKVDAQVKPPVSSEVNIKTEDSGATADPTGGAKVIVKGWNPETKKSIEGRIATQVQADADIKEVEIAEDTVRFVYATPARLLGFIPITMNLTVTSDTEGRVKVNFPWYRMFTKTEFKNASNALNAVYQHNQTNLEFLKTKTGADVQVEIFLQLSKAMHDMAKSIIQNIRA